MCRWSSTLLLLGVALAGCSPGGGSTPTTQPDRRGPETGKPTSNLPTVTLEVSGMS